MQLEAQSLVPSAALHYPGPLLTERQPPSHDQAGSAVETSSVALDVDFLTGLASRACFEHHLQQCVDDVAARRRAGAAVLFLDLDRFKRVNDTLGHAVGDDLLRLVSNRLRGALQPDDVVARLGGDEFAILRTALFDHASLEQLSLRLIELVQRTYLIEGHVVHVGTSIGIALTPDHGVSAKELLRRADLALYESKNRGRATMHFFQHDYEVRAMGRRSLEMELRKAIVLRQLGVFYQPQISVETGEVTGFEALLRWSHPERGLLLPVDFLPLAEEIGMAVPIGEWVLKTVTAEAAKWPANLVFAVNASASQFEHPGFAASVQRALSRAGLPGHRLEIEVKEELLLRNDASVPGTLAALRELGVHVTLDNFGTGVASLSQLARLPFDKIKIDRTLLTLQRSDPKNRAIIRAVAALGQSLGICTHAEGVESLEHLRQVQLDGCHTVQGFFYSEAVPADQLHAVVHRLQNGHTHMEPA